MYLVVDLAQRICTVALGGDAPDISSPGWPVRMPLGRMHSWLSRRDCASSKPRAPMRDLNRPVACAPGSDVLDINSVINEINQCLSRWQVRADGVVLVVLSEVGREQACRMTELLGCRELCVPRFPYMISPRGVVPAGILREYSKRMAPARMDWQVLRDAFVDLLEKAADDVQAARFEQDDSIVDRYAELRWAGEQQSALVPVESLSDPQWLISEFRQIAQEMGLTEPSPAVAVEVLSLHVRCAVELPDMFPRPLSSSDGQLNRAVKLPAEDAIGPIYERKLLLAGDHGKGPAGIAESRANICIPERWSWHINDMGQLICRQF